jgi:hypothetical protein
MAYRTPATTCENHPMADGSETCTSCGASLCESCAAYDGLRSWCESCATAQRYREARRRHWRGLAAGFLVALALIVLSQLKRSPSDELRASFLDPDLPTVTWRY